MPRAAGTARDAAHKARELADFLDEYADHLDAPDHEELVGELAEVVTARLHRLRLSIRKARETDE
jgi:hypothetical protein